MMNQLRLVVYPIIYTLIISSMFTAHLDISSLMEVVAFSCETVPCLDGHLGLRDLIW